MDKLSRIDSEILLHVTTSLHMFMIALPLSLASRRGYAASGIHKMLVDSLR